MTTFEDPPTLSPPRPLSRLAAEFVWDLHSDREHWSDQMFELYGYSPAQRPAMTGALHRSMTYATDRHAWDRLIAWARDHGEKCVLQHRIVGVCGTVRAVVTSVWPAATDDRGVAVLSGTAVDITMMQRAPSLTSSTVMDELSHKVAHLTHALQSRDLIGQAKGILMARHKVTADQAFDLLVMASQRSNRKLVQIAEDVVHTGEIGGAR